MYQTNGGSLNGSGSGSGSNHGGSANQQQQGGQGANNGAGMAQLVYPALHLQPLNDTFAPKQISLAPPGPQNKIKIGRQTNAKTVPQPSNGYFDSKVLSRMHAEVWSQDGKVFIKDIKSSNGTFINGARLSPEGQESDTFELHSDDMVEFGIDIVGEDNKTIIHHKVACRVFLVMTAEEALGLRHDFAALYRGGIAGSTLNHHVVGPGAEGGFRRSKTGGTGGYGNNGTQGGLMSFDHILHRLQAELQKSRETAGELGNLNSAMNDIGETLGGGLPPMQHPPYQHLVPSATDPAAAAREEEQRKESSAREHELNSEIKFLEQQVRETQSVLKKQIQKLSKVETRLDDTEAFKADLLALREQVHSAHNEAVDAREQLASKRAAVSIKEEDDMDDNASVLSVDTVVPDGNPVGRGPIGVDEIDSLANISLEKQRDTDESANNVKLLNKLKEHIGPLAPPDDESNALRSGHEVGSDRRHDELSRRLEAMESQLEKALELGRLLAGQHAEATDNVRKLEDRIKSLESSQTAMIASKSVPSKAEADGVKIENETESTQLDAVAKQSAEEIYMPMTKWEQWRETFETKFAKERAGLASDREDLRRVVRMWDGLNREVEDLVEGAHTDDGGASIVATEDSQAMQKRAVQNAGASKKKKKRRGGNNSSTASYTPPVGVRRTTSAVGLGSSAELNRHLRALIYTDDYNLLVRETHLESESSTSASSSASDTSRSVTSKMTDDTSVGSSSSNAGGGEKNGGEGGEDASHPVDGSLEQLPDGVRKRAVASMASGRHKGRPPSRWADPRGPAAPGMNIDSSHALPFLSAAGVLVVGMTAYIMAGKGLGPGGFGTS